MQKPSSAGAAAVHGLEKLIMVIYRFNWAARKLHKRLSQLGANEIYPGGEADQQHPEG